MSNGNSQNSGSPGWSASFFMQTTDVARAVAAAVNSTPPSMVVSSKDDSSSQIRRLQRQVVKAFKGFSSPPEVKKRNYNPEILTSQKRQWASFHLQLLDQRPVKEPSRLFESMVVVGLHPNSDVQALQQQILARKSENSSKSRGSLNGCNLARVEPNFEPQVLFVYPPEKQLPLKYKDLLSFCFPGGTEVRAVERTPSMSELNEILIGQEHLKQSDLSFVFRLQVADDSTLYGCCVLVEEAVHQPSGLISMISEKQTFSKSFSRHILTTPRCYCILSRLPFFELHFAVLNSIFTEERLERLTKGMGMLDLDMVEGLNTEEELEEKPKDILAEDVPNGSMEVSEISTEGSTPRKIAEDASQLENQMLEGDFDLLSERIHNSVVSPNNSETGMLTPKGETRISDVQGITVDELATNKQPIERRLPEAVLPLLRYCQYESSESSISFQGSPCEDRNFRSDGDEAEMEEASSSGQDDHSDHNDILEWAKANNYGSLQIICEYYRLRCPARGTTVTFQPLEHLPSVEFHRPAETLLHGSSTIDIRSCSKSLELAEAHNSLLAEEEATALSVWTVACICGSLRLDNVLAIFTGALLEKQIVVVCSNLGILSALVLSIIPLIRPYHWQSLLVPVLPNDMLDFLDAPVPYVVGVKNKTTEVHSKSANVIVVDADKNQVVQSPRLPQLPQHKELISSLRPYHAKLVGEHYLARKRPVYECTEIQIEAAKGFLAELRSYLDLLCSNLRSHTITNVQSNDDKVSLLLKDSFIDSFPSRDRSFMKHFVDTQLFSVHSDLVLSFVQKE